MKRLLTGLGAALLFGAGLAASGSIGSASTNATTTTTVVTTTAPKSPPANTSLPTISGTAQDGALLTASNGSWTNSPTSFSYQWLRCNSDGGSCNSISGANSTQYTVTSRDVGHRLRVKVTAKNSAGSGNATSDATGVVQASGSAPANTTAPTIGGTPQEGSVLTVNNGTWSGTQPIDFKYGWQRCDGAGNGCATFVDHKSSPNYTLKSADVGHTLRALVTATNARGTSTAMSGPTAVIAAAKPQSSTIAVGQVSLPDRLVIDRVSFSPNPITNRQTTIVARFHVSEINRGLSVQGALVFALGLPYGWTFNAPETTTDASGWVTLNIRPTPNMPLRRGDLVMFVRARKPGENLLAGVSTRRLVQVGIR